jgi:flagellar assembly protein FliH
MTEMTAMVRSEQAREFVSEPIPAWQAPVIDIDVRASGRVLSPEQMREEQQRVFAAAEASGRAAGLAAAQKQLDAQLKKAEQTASSLQVALNALSRPLAQIDDEVHAQIAELALALAHGLLRRELRADPTQIIGMVRETVALLPASARGVRIALHPEDAALVRERLLVAGPESAWSVIDDPVLGRGDCRVHTDYAQIDARIEMRLKAMLAELLGDERARPRTAEPG